LDAASSILRWIIDKNLIIFDGDLIPVSQTNRQKYLRAIFQTDEKSGFAFNNELPILRIKHEHWPRTPVAREFYIALKPSHTKHWPL
jgi:hypothetical protein